MFKLYKCLKCGQVVAKVKATGCTPVCCGEPMMELNPNTEDAAMEKHVPVIEANGNVVTVKVGSAYSINKICYHLEVEEHIFLDVQIHSLIQALHRHLSSAKEVRSVYLLIRRCISHSEIRVTED